MRINGCCYFCLFYSSDFMCLNVDYVISYVIILFVIWFVMYIFFLVFYVRWFFYFEVYGFWVVFVIIVVEENFFFFIYGFLFSVIFYWIRYVFFVFYFFKWLYYFFDFRGGWYIKMGVCCIVEKFIFGSYGLNFVIDFFVVGIDWKKRRIW